MLLVIFNLDNVEELMLWRSQVTDKILITIVASMSGLLTRYQCWYLHQAYEFETVI